MVMDIDVIIVLSVLSVVVSSINLYCIILIVYSKRLHKASHMAISSLIIAHILQGIVVIPSYAIKRSKTWSDSWICDLFRFTYMFTNYASCLSLVVIALDRCFGVTYPLKYKIFIRSRRMVYWLIFVWIYALVLCLIPFANPGSKKPGKCYRYIPQAEWTIAMLFINTMVPFVVIFVCYSIILKKVQKVLNHRRNNRNLTVNTRAIERQWRKSKVTVIIVLFYVLCWGPSFLYYILDKLCKVCFPDDWNNMEAEKKITFAMKVLTFIDGIIAPLLYCLSNKNFLLARTKLFLLIRSKLTHIDEDSFTFTVTNITTIQNNYHSTVDNKCTLRNQKGLSRSIISDLSVSFNEESSPSVLSERKFIGNSLTVNNRSTLGNQKGRSQSIISNLSVSFNEESSVSPSVLSERKFIGNSLTVPAM